jgi:hypothetical protein
VIDGQLATAGSSDHGPDRWPAIISHEAEVIDCASGYRLTDKPQHSRIYCFSTARSREPRSGSDRIFFKDDGRASPRFFGPRPPGHSLMDDRLKLMNRRPIARR